MRNDLLDCGSVHETLLQPLDWLLRCIEDMQILGAPRLGADLWFIAAS